MRLKTLNLFDYNHSVNDMFWFTATRVWWKHFWCGINSSKSSLI